METCFADSYPPPIARAARWPRWAWAWILLLLALLVAELLCLPTADAPFADAPLLPLDPRSGLALHVAAALALGWMAWRRWRRPFLALASATLLAFHPLGLELSICRIFWALPMTAILIALALGVIHARTRPRKAIIVGAFLLLGLLALAVHLHLAAVLRPWWEPDVAIVAPLADALASASRPVVVYCAAWLKNLRLALMAWPLNVAPDQALPLLREPRLWVGGVWLAVAAWGAFSARTRWPEMHLALSWMLLAHLLGLLPAALGIAPPAADAYAYLVLPGAALGMATLLDRQGPGPMRWTGLSLMLALLLALTFLRTTQTRSGRWAAAAFANPRSVTALHQLALRATAAGDPAAASAFLSEASRLSSP